MTTTIPQGHCTKCADPGVLLKGTKPTGTIEQVCGVDVYVSGAKTSGLHIIICSDVFGMHAPNAQITADEMAAEGFCVWLPDYFHGNPLPHQMNKEELMSKFASWRENHTQEHSVKIITQLCDKLLSEKTTRGVGVAGYCWGSISCLHILAKEDPKIIGGVIGHPAQTEKFPDPTLIKHPLHFLVAETDPAFPEEFKNDYIKRVPANLATESFYPGTTHGFACRPVGEQELEMRNASLKQTVEFFKAGCANS
eukprot:Gregarina_sp_Poly_1__21@NODE_1004_length_5397_cov_173_232270_g704_i0_p4_GENE_NODE_1004_length_5397_cov_173_232270_g704_i0NODE_1004_length_5397_cov_173_232270_g704_i0_p4_ORF_typecomplete_len252_score32_64DLH/PF01738_18/2_8e36Hydrolase_4/PF12146_8/7_9e06Abhydrolase_6/PF12697_7/0_0028Chlorophyllase/PF07224_11/0_011Abhydrolase_1/PF00561_20/0_074Chlorophyllase2/PF12740_7/0_12_NODE_1004_length_5397_cov_173_232270_g704_i031786